MGRALGINRSGRPHAGRTQLDHTIYATWAGQAKYPDKVMADWLKDGTPMGIEEEAHSVGIFAEVFEKADEEIHRKLEFWGERFVNDSSLEESPYSAEVLAEHVSKLLATKVGPRTEARKILGGRSPISSKIALVTSEKDRGA